MGTPCDLRKDVFQARPGKDSLDQEKGLMLSHFKNCDHAFLFMDKYFLHMKSQPKLYYPRQKEHINKKPQLISKRR
jgi:hypothetical protein